ncbi:MULTISPECIES: tRNA 5-methoxyuridine(34)/uridine 5-oxyacetic acid(34) synthase CmoB [unclassified Nitratiruptor]|uniref:tRNA 5-methoxyuridine(34)/uridine 5-oxyacetic acid(34) synthase CmoB n=1 Tax=unclassified Nitratiruptor TaxID=2624044 RepID=UPI00191560EE|nr:MULTISPECIES: tRNA 5-methoxyuridine(34)/uridine 5-oxyacetic acid(34) synthase CmoB [unclassified Nitratiruptor]BCD60234.1 tRNA (mo5U34)-methyltransferase [Nitratiruptor sp. YY08-10]BCD64277.1 tRNA (mo5U34)-methyltransferase [Nitratiruptor sp. YY08-14]
MGIEEIKSERERWLQWKNIAPLREKLCQLPKVECDVELGDIIKITGDIPQSIQEQIFETAWAMRPWRKGPFEIFGTYIDSEWKSYIKYNLLEPHFDLEGKDVADIGCNNGYYMFRMLTHHPKSLTGFDPSPLFRTQFDFINHFVQSSIVYELLGVEHLPLYRKKFDVIFCLGVLYHRSDPIAMLKWLKQGLKECGEIFLDTFYIEGEDPVALCPAKTYSKIPNVHFVPTIKALQNWCEKAGFEYFEILATKPTTFEEQRKTDWILGESLEDFLDPADPQRTVEGYPAPKRVYIKLRRKR